MLVLDKPPFCNVDAASGELSRFAFLIEFYIEFRNILNFKTVVKIAITQY